MTQVDQFESVFRGAVKPIFEHRCPHLGKVLVLTDLAAPEAEAFGKRVQAFLAAIEGREQKAVVWDVRDGTAFDSVETLVPLVTEAAPDLIVTYRNLHTQAWRTTFTLGRYLDVLAQETSVPIFVVPNPHAESDLQAFPAGPPRWDGRGTRVVMAMTDHLQGDHVLVNAAAHLVADKGTLVLAHIEDDVVFERYIEAIGKIPEIDTDAAREMIQDRLLLDPHNYIRSCREGLTKAGHTFDVQEVIGMGHRVSKVRRIVSEHNVDLLVVHTKDEDQYAMHGLAYPLVVELRDVALLLI